MATINKNNYVQELANNTKYHIVNGCEASNAALDYFNLWSESELDDGQRIFVAIDKKTGIQYACLQDGTTWHLTKLDDIDYLDERDWYLDHFKYLKYDDGALKLLREEDLDVSDDGIRYQGEEPIVIDGLTNTESSFDDSDHFDGILQACCNTDLAALLCGAYYVYRGDDTNYYFCFVG